MSGGHFTHCQQPTTDRLKVLQGETGERESLCYCKCKVHRAACYKYELGTGTIMSEGRFPSHSQHPLSQLVCLVFLSCLQSSCMLPGSAAGTLALPTPGARPKWAHRGSEHTVLQGGNINTAQLIVPPKPSSAASYGTNVHSLIGQSSYKQVFRVKKLVGLPPQLELLARFNYAW